MAPFIFIVVGMVTLVFTLFPIKATVWLEERLLVTLYMFPVFLSVIFVPTETDGVGVTVGAEVIAGVGVAVGTESRLALEAWQLSQFSLHHKQYRCMFLRLLLQLLQVW